MFKLVSLLLLSLVVADDMPDLGWPGWTCDPTLMAPSKKVPTNANAVRYADIKVVAAIGDSLTAANGAGAQFHDPVQLILQYRGLAFQIGGDKSLDEHITLPNVLRKFNPNLFGYSIGIGSANVWEYSHLNQGIPGAKTRDMAAQARTVVSLIQSHPNQINMDKDWKLVNIFIGANDLCAYCSTNGTGAYAPSTFGANIQEAVQIFKDNLPRTIVSLTGMMDMGMLRQIDHDRYFCDAMHRSECSCEMTMTPQEISDACRLEQASEQQIQDSAVFEGKDDFAFVIQPFLNDLTVPPLLPNGDVDISWFAPDCFHFSQLGHANVGKHLWNTILQPVGLKQRSVNLSDPSIPLNCPDASCPFFRTVANSQDCSQYLQLNPN